MEHTQGNWVVQNWLIVGDAGHEVAEVFPNEVDEDVDADGVSKEAKANARLIAAAPDLLAACKYALDATYIDSDVVELALEALSSVRSFLGQAIAKAEKKPNR